MTTTSDIELMKRQVAESSHVLDHQGLVDFHGHISARMPGTNVLYIKPVLRAHNKIRPEDIIAVDIDAYLEGGDALWVPDDQKGRTIDAPLPPRETALHAAIMRARPDVNSVVHTHQLIATAVGTGNVPIKAVVQPSGALRSRDAHLREARPDHDTTVQGQEVAECLGDRGAALLRGHGVVVVGESMDHSVSNTIYLERAAIMQVIASIVGTPTPMSDEYATRFGADWAKRASHAYEYFRSLVPSLNTRRKAQGTYSRACTPHEPLASFVGRVPPLPRYPSRAARAA